LFILINFIASLHKVHALPIGNIEPKITAYWATLRILISAIIHTGTGVVSTTYSSIAAQFGSGESAKIPLGQVGVGDHIANVVALLASPVFAWPTGSCIRVNGGKMAAAL
jgi:hypothetical protein